MSNELWLNVNGVFKRTNITEEKLAGIIVENQSLNTVKMENDRLTGEVYRLTNELIVMEAKVNTTLRTVALQFGEKLKGMLT